MSRNTPDLKKRLNISAKCSDILLFRALLILVGTLFGPVDLHC